MKRDPLCLKYRYACTGNSDGTDWMCFVYDKGNDSGVIKRRKNMTDKKELLNEDILSLVSGGRLRYDWKKTWMK